MSNASKKGAGRSASMLYGLSPWLLVGVSAILGLAVFVLALRSSEKEREHITHNFLARGDALIWALEAGTRTAAGGEGQRLLLQPLIEQTARQPGVVYMSVVDESGQVLAHSNPGTSSRPKEFMPSRPPESVGACLPSGFGEDGVFEVYRGFAPLSGDLLGTHWSDGGHRAVHTHALPVNTRLMDRKDARSFAFVGFAQETLDEAIAEDFRTNLLTTSAVAALALAGFVSLFWAHSYKRSRKKLKDTQAVSLEVVSNLPLGLVTSDPEGRLAMINAPAKAMLRLGDTSGNILVSDIPGLDWAALLQPLAQGGKVLNRELELALPGEAGVPLTASASEVRDEDGLFLGNVFILQDISAIKRLQKEAQRNERLTALGNLAAGVAHEIRNPLSSIKGLATYLAGKMQPGGPEQKAAGTMVTEVNRLNRVVSELLDFARPNAMKLAPADINEVVGSALRLAEADFAERKVRVDFTPAAGFPRVYVSPERLTQALLNLFLNAAQAMDEGGVLTLRVERANGDEFALIVTDNGAGMDPATLASIFTPYFTTKPTGTGLGLAIVHQIIEGHGGTIAVASKPGAGSTFTLRLPLHSK